MNVTGLPFLSSTFSRVTNTLSRNTILSNIQSTQAAILKLQEQLASGKKFDAISEDPLSAKLSMAYNARIAQNDQNQKAIDKSIRNLDFSSSVMQSMNDIMTNALDIAIRESSSAGNTQTRQSSATEVDELIQRAVGLGNSYFEGKYIFSGSASGEPYEYMGDSVYFKGNMDDINLILGKGLSNPINISGPDAFTFDFGSIESSNIANTNLTFGDFDSTVTTGGAANQLIDNSLIGDGVDAYKGAELVSISGANKGERRIITGFDNQTGQITVGNAFSNNFANGDQFKIITDFNPDITYGGIESGVTGGGAANQFIDTSLIDKGSNVFNNLEVLVTSGSNIGEVRKISSFDSATGTIQFANPFSNAFAASDKYVIQGVSTSLNDINNGDGVTGLGSIKIDDGVNPSIELDLNGAKTIRDIIDRINQSALGASGTGTISAGIDSDGRTLLIQSTTGTLTLEDIGSGSIASELGIVKTVAVGGSITGSDLRPSTTLSTPTSLLKSGSGIDLTGGLSITNGQNTGIIDLSTATSMNDIINTINSSNLYLNAEINDSANGLKITSKLSGVNLKIDENGGTTALDLGILSTLAGANLREIGTYGIRSVNGNDFRIHLMSGDTIDIDISNANTMSDIVDIINSDSENSALGSPLFAQINPLSGNELQLIDSSADNGNDFYVEGLNNSTSVDDLGILLSIGNPPGADASLTLTGGGLPFNGKRSVDVFSSLIELKQKLLNDDPTGIMSAQENLKASQNHLLTSVAEVGARSATANMLSNRLEEETAQLNVFLADAEDADLAEVATSLESEQIILQAGLSVAANILKISLLNYL